MNWHDLGFTSGPLEARSWWYLSFADVDLPEGSRWLGVVVVQGHGMVGACHAAQGLGINPGGQVAGVEINPQYVPHPDYCNRLLSRVDLDAMPAPTLNQTVVN